MALLGIIEATSYLYSGSQGPHLAAFRVYHSEFLKKPLASNGALHIMDHLREGI